ncbi:MAG: hypothetical protein JJ855_11030 [Rhodospirillales bacterium]|nr:hypothetical protein [Rhodospirillales bacterium]
MLKRISTYLFCCAYLLSGCQTTGGPGSLNTESIIGPQLSSIFDPKRAAHIDPEKPKLDVIVPVFDPGLSKEAKEYKEEGVWPELRRAEANRFAYKLKQAMDETGAFGAVRVTPDATATGDLYVIGKIDESNGEDVEFTIDVVDISGKHWFTRSFDHEVDVGFHKSVRNEGKDPYDPVFEKAANRVAIELEDYKEAQLNDIKRVTDLRFGAHLSEEAFSDYMSIDGGKVHLAAYPSDDDPMLRRTQAIRVRDQLFVDSLQEQYQGFSEKMDTSYLIWQEQSLLEIEAEREANQKAAAQAVGGIALIALGVLAAAAGARSNNYNKGTLGVTAGTVAAVGGGMLIGKSFETSEESKVHRDALNELGESIDVDLGPRVVSFEERTVELTGDAKEQFQQWREFLKKIYAQERTPEKQL